MLCARRDDAKAHLTLVAGPALASLPLLAGCMCMLFWFNRDTTVEFANVACADEQGDALLIAALVIGWFDAASTALSWAITTGLARRICHAKLHKKHNEERALCWGSHSAARQVMLRTFAGARSARRGRSCRAPSSPTVQRRLWKSGMSPGSKSRWSR